MVKKDTNMCILICDTEKGNYLESQKQETEKSTDV